MSAVRQLRATLIHVLPIAFIRIDSQALAPSSGRLQPRGAIAVVKQHALKLSESVHVEEREWRRFPSSDQPYQYRHLVTTKASTQRHMTPKASARRTILRPTARLSSHLSISA